MVEAALTLPMMVLLTLGGLTVLWWQHNKTMLNVAVHDEARRVAKDGMVAGNLESLFHAGMDYVDGRRGDANRASREYGLPAAHLYSLQVPKWPLSGPERVPMTGTVVAVACARPAGTVPKIPVASVSGPAYEPPVRGLPDWIRRQLQPIKRVGNAIEEVLSEASDWADQLIWMHRLGRQVIGSDPYARDQAGYYVVDQGLEFGMQYVCKSGREMVLTAGAVIRREETVPQR
jgi:hypothetical protein